MNTRSMNWNLSEAEVERWQREWPESRRRGRQSVIAGDLKKVPVASRGGGQKTKTADTWEVYLSHFFKGEAKFLAMVLGDDNVAHVVAKGLDLPSAEALRAVHRRVRGLDEEGPFDTRLPGFEDRGVVPVLAAYLAPPAGGSNGLGAAQDGEQFELFPPTAERLLRAATPGRTSRLIVVHGPTGSGKSMILRVVHAQLHSAGIGVTLGTLGTAPVAIIDRWEVAAPELREGLSRWLGQPGRVAVIACLIDDHRHGFQGEMASMQLPHPLPSHHAMQYLAHLGTVLAEGFGIRFDHEALRPWFEDDPVAATVAGQCATLGLLARAVVDGASVPPPVHQWPALLVKHAHGQTHRDERTPEGTFFEAAGEAFVSAIAKEFLATGSDSIERRRALELAAQEAARFGAKVQLDDTGAFRPVAFAERAGVLRAAAGRIGFAHPSLGRVAAWSIWRDHLPEMLARPEWHDALVAAAEKQGDLVLRAAMTATPDVFAMGMLGLTRILRAKADFADAELFTHAFRACAAWWAHAPKHVGAPDAAWTVPATDRVGGSSPLLLLAQAGHTHRKLLPPNLDALDLERDVPEASRRWLSAFGVAVAEAPRLDAVLRFVAPANANEFPREGDIRDSGDWTGGDLPGVVPQDWEVWWRDVVVPVWEMRRDVEALVSGVAPGSRVSAGLSQNSERGLNRWLAALEWVARDGDVGGVARAVELALLRGSWRAQAGIATLLRGLPRLRRRLSGPLYEALTRLERPPWDSQPTKERGLLEVVLVEFLDPERRDELWARWATATAEHVPWRAFAAAGLPLERVAEWAMAGGTDALQHKHLRTPIYGVTVPGPSHRRTTLEAVLQTGDVPALVYAYASGLPEDLEYPARLRILNLRPQEFPAERIAGAVRSGRMEGSLLLRQLLPRPQDEPAWQQLLRGTESWPERLAFVAQWCAGQPAPRWSPLVSALDHIEEGLRLAAKEQPEGARSASEFETFISYGGSSVAFHIARKDVEVEEEDRVELVRRLLGSDLWAPAFTEWGAGGLWPLAFRILPRGEFLELAARDVRNRFGEDSRPGRLIAIIYSGQVDVVAGLLSDQVLAPAAARALGVVVYGDRAVPLNLAKQAARERGFVQDGVVNELAHLAIRHLPEETFAWVVEQLATTMPTDVIAWWRVLMPTFARTSARGLAAKAFFSATAEELRP
jgi:hypothetical protein